MSLGFHVTAAARKDAVEAQRFLEGDTTDAGPRFREELERCWRYIAQYPHGFRIRHRQFRYATLDVFRYHVIHSVGQRSIVVHRIRHMHQQPLKRYFGGST
ncbi:MAG: type II toxin-antitoxin system RelE/ParE family toxin [Flavobacteriales bacterium]|nr:type II toxin-antitoxin system RelE/ParE family toxin [Flavobacteriales bacterium]MBK6550836.1 type II toxin-antitoxin system RelE/ParE family toxin [Flavobacteriales bacterium]MBK6882392.1 type II toxin-antitoxin system RelE/ParE family toxin [Flavobacteriales bacterium]MBK7101394.1 type II toxin-antitoxin system RelE/ParE family toxin [Flavobacteriales bacterium]MBK7112101.1 type II toxin-antitoxin system RelE/ParE family toxin [Flavobacteriales bacterium]